MTEQEWLGDNQLSLDIWHKKYQVNGEGFEQWLDRVSGGNGCIRQLIKDRKFIFGGRILAGRGAISDKKTLSNCFTGDTVIYTSEGRKTLKELEGKSVKVLSNSSWREAEIKQFGVQKLYELTLRRGSSVRKFRVTGNHLWYIQTGATTVLKETVDLTEGDYIPSSVLQCYSQYKPNPIGVAHGFFMGDGDHVLKKSLRVNICGGKEDLLPYYMPDTMGSSGGVLTISGMPQFFLKYPELSESPSYLYGWLAGYFAADGNISKRNGGCTISSADIRNLEYVQDVLCVLGIPCEQIRVQERVSNLTGKLGKVYILSINKFYLNESFFIRKKQREIYLLHPKRRNLSWKVESVVPTNLEETVYCAVVPKTHSFTLDGGIKTHNCYALPMPEDNLESIFDVGKMAARTYSVGGGCGINISKLRPKNSIVHNAATTTTGPTSFMELYSFITGLIGQAGRRGALMLSMECTHPDIEEFINLKTKQGVCEKANISVMVNDKFMEAAEKDEDWVTEFNSPETGLITKTFKARKLLELLAKRNWEWAEPGVLFWDRITSYNLNSNNQEFKLVGTNPCQPASAVLLTPAGLTTMGKLKEGDLIWSSEGWTKVVKKWSTGIKDVYRYRTSRGMFIGTENHRLMSEGIKVEAKDCESIDSLTGGFRERDFAFLPEAVMDGLVLGDGYVHKASNNLVLLCIGMNDSGYFTSEVKDLIKEKRPGIGRYAYEVTTSIQPYELPRKWEISIPDRYMEADRQTVCSLLRGLYSANGSVINPPTGYSRITYKTTSPVLRDQIQILLSSLGIGSYYTTNKSAEIEFSNGIYTCKASYDINITSDRTKFMNLIGFLQKYKTKKVIQGDSHKRKMQELILEKTYLGKEEVFDITVDNSTHTYWTGGLNVSNCGEIPLQAGGACLLGSINLSEFVKKPFTSDAYVNMEELAYTVSMAVIALNRVLDENIPAHPLEIQRNNARDWRAIGLGTMGMADMLIKLGVTYGSERSLEILEEVYSLIAQTAVSASLTLAIEFGAFPKCDGNLIAESSFIKSLNLPAQMIEDIRKYGLRNSQLLTCAPTGSIGTMLQVSTGIEPNFALKYVRRTQSLAEKDTYYEVNAKIVDDYFKSTSFNEYVNDLDDNKDLPNYFIESKDIAPINRIKVQAMVQKYTDNSISSTINLPKEATVEDVYKIYMEAWKQGLKGVTVYRQGCNREGILTVKKPDNIPLTGAPKRPETLPCDIYKVKVRGEEFIVCVGLYNYRPYEIFVFRPVRKFSLTGSKGQITKVRKGYYSLSSADFEIANLLSTELSVEERAATLYSSMLLRHGVSLKYIIKTARKVDDNITSFSSAMCRVLAKYLPAEVEGKCPECGADLIHEGGCVHCQSCSYSRCD